MTPRSLKTGARAERSASFFITLKTGEVLELTISAGECLAVLLAVLRIEGGRPAMKSRKPFPVCADAVTGRYLSTVDRCAGRPTARADLEEKNNLNSRPCARRVPFGLGGRSVQDVTPPPACSLPALCDHLCTGARRCLQGPSKGLRWSPQVVTVTTPAAAAFCGQKGEPVPHFLLDIFGISEDSRAGELLASTERNKGATVKGRMAVERRDTHNATLADMGLTRDESSRYQQLAAMPAEHFETAVATARATAGEVTTALACPFEGASKGLRGNGWTTVGEPFPKSFGVTQCHARSRAVTVRTVARSLLTADLCQRSARRMPLARPWQMHGSAMAHAIETHPRTGSLNAPENGAAS